VLVADNGVGQVPQITATFVVPETPYGSNYIQLVRGFRAADPYGFSFTVTPQITATPASTPPGGKVTVKGMGFPKADTGILLFDGKDTGLSFTANDTGSFSIDYTVPEVIRGSHTIKVESAELSSTVSITAKVEVAPQLRLDPQRPSINTPLTVAGVGFASNKGVTIMYDAMEVSKGVKTDAAGSFSYTFTVPETSEKDHIITVTDESGNKATWQLPVESEPPPKSETLMPRDERFGWIGAEEVSFRWEEVADSSGVTYTVEVGKDLKFFPLAPGMRKTGLTEPATTMLIQPGTYYWRVRAVDGAGNEGEWALSPYPFSVGFFPLWSLVAGSLLLLVLFVLLIRSFTRRIKEYYY